MNGLSLFSGVGGIELGLQKAAEVKTICYVEKDPYATAILVQRMQEGKLPNAPIWDDVTTFNGFPFRGKVDVIYGGFPCQDISQAGKGEGIKKTTRSGLWFEFSRIIGEVRPKLVFIENVSILANRGLDIVLSGLAEAGYDARWTDLRASDVGAPHQRERLFILAYSKLCGCVHGQDEKQSAEDGEFAQCHAITESKVAYSKRIGCGGWSAQSGEQGRSLEEDIGHDRNGVRSEVAGCDRNQRVRVGKEEVAYSNDSRSRGDKQPSQLRSDRIKQPSTDTRGTNKKEGFKGWESDPADQDPKIESYVGRVADGIPNRVDRIKCLGNAVVPQQAAEAWRILTKEG